jgi:energy-coupling factor transporter ATP-binding protein EcfA2
MAFFQAPQLNDEQQAAVQTALAVAADCGHMALIGPAGTGKTTTIRAIAHALERIHPTKSVLLLAPTHKARRQLQAARLPRGAQAWTVQRFCQVRPEQWRDQDKFRMTGNQLQMIKQLQSRFSFVIVDESSMVTSQLAAAVVDTAMHAGVPVMFAGDPYQLPPVAERQQEAEYDEFADDGPETAMASEFVDAPVIARLNRVMRHGGPVLSFATSIRDDWSILHSFPDQSAKDEESEIRLSFNFEEDFVAAFIDSITDHYSDPETLYKVAPRALCYMNGTVRGLTMALRGRTYGSAAMVTWQPGELITFKDYTKTDAGFIHSSADAIVIDSEVVELPEIKTTVGYVTPATSRSKNLTMSFSGTVQRMTVQPMNPDGTPDPHGVHTVHAPLCGDTAPIDRYRELKQALLNRRLGADHAGWKWLKEEVKERYLNVIYSAFVMTVHKSQGSTFRDVFVHRDLLHVGEDDRETRNALLYVAATRASKSLTFGASNAHV